MHKITSTLIAATLGFALIGNAQAGHDRRHGYDHRPPHYQKHRHHHHPAPRVVRHHHRDWVGPAAMIALTGVAIGAAMHYAPAPQPVYAAPPPPSGNWYYCGSSGQYYPYTDACPEGWQSVAPR